MDIKDIAAIVTGGASGLGAATARALAEAGAKVTVLDRDGNGAAAVANGIGGLGLNCDVADGEAVEAALDEARAAHGLAASWSTAPGLHRPCASSGATAR